MFTFTFRTKVKKQKSISYHGKITRPLSGGGGGGGGEYVALSGNNLHYDNKNLTNIKRKSDIQDYQGCEETHL